MIVYTGKQFWNDFNNWDEALFQDANRPRDDDKFQIRPWFNARKNDLRIANSWIAAQWTFQWVKVQAWQSNMIWNTAYMKDSYTASDFSDLNSFVAADGTTYSAEAVAKWIKTTIVWRPYANASNWDIVIWKSGVYAVTCQCVFIAPSWYSVSNSVNYKFYVSLMMNWVASQWTQWRWCGTIDAHSVFYIGWFDTWDRLNAGFLHTYTTNAFLCQPSINVYRLS